MARLRRDRELRRLTTIEDRYAYLRLGGEVGEITFGFERWMNQAFYSSTEWKQVRHHVIARDLGFDMGVQDHPINGKVFVHHMNPMTPDDIQDGNDAILDPEFLVTVSLRTHNAIHYGDPSQLPQPMIQRRAGDTVPWGGISKG